MPLHAKPLTSFAAGCVGAVSAFLPGALTAATWHVPEDFSTIAGAVAGASSGDTILVGPGTYAGYIEFSDKSLSVRSTHGPLATIIVARGGVSPQYALEIHFGEIVGFTIRNEDPSSRGIFASLPGARIASNIFDGTVDPDGGTGEAITVFASAPLIERNVFHGYHCDNAQSESSVVWVVNDGSPTIRNNVWWNNDCRGLRVQGATHALRVFNNTFVDNSTAIHLSSSMAGADFANNLLVGGGTGVKYAFFPFSWRHNLVYGFTTLYDGPQDLTGSSGNISAAPMLEDHLPFPPRSSSPVVDSGAIELLTEDDFFGLVRPVDGDQDGLALADIGAIEYRTTTREIPTLGSAARGALVLLLAIAGWIWSRR